MNLDSPFWENRVRSEYAPKRVRSVCAPNGRMADWLGNHQAGKGVHTVDTLAVDEKGTHIMSTPGGRAQFNLGRERDAVSR